MKREYGYASEWNKLERLAFAYLEEPHTIPKAQEFERRHSRIRIWHYPAFDENRSWTIYQLGRPSDRVAQSVLRQVTWSREFDAQRLTLPMEGLKHGLHPQPTIEVRDRPLDTDEFKRRMASLEGISFNLFAARPVGLDGEGFGIATAHVKAEWWCEGPDTWKELAAWAADMREWLTSIANQPACPPTSP